MDIKEYIKDIKELRTKAEECNEDAPGGAETKLSLLTDAHTLMGRVSAQMDADYANVYAFRKITYAKAKAEAKSGDKANAGELAIMDLRMAEAQAKGKKSMWNNEYHSLAQKLYELRLKVKVDLSTSTSGGGI